MINQLVSIRFDRMASTSLQVAYLIGHKMKAHNKVSAEQFHTLKMSAWSAMMCTNEMYIAMGQLMLPSL